MKNALLATLLLVVACEPATAPTPPTASGTWATFLTLHGRERPSGGAWVALRCEGGVVTVLDDLDGTINGGFTKGALACWFGAEANPAPIEWASPIAGRREGEAVTLDDGYCTYTGTLAAPDSMGGTVRCDRDSGATELDLEGTWNATK